MATIEERRAELLQQREATLTKVANIQSEIESSTDQLYGSRIAAQRRRGLRRSRQSLDPVLRGIERQLRELDEEERAAGRANITGRTTEEELQAGRELSQRADAQARSEAYRAEKLAAAAREAEAKASRSVDLVNTATGEVKTFTRVPGSLAVAVQQPTQPQRMEATPSSKTSRGVVAARPGPRLAEQTIKNVVQGGGVGGFYFQLPETYVVGDLQYGENVTPSTPEMTYTIKEQPDELLQRRVYTFAEKEAMKAERFETEALYQLKTGNILGGTVQAGAAVVGGARAFGAQIAEKPGQTALAIVRQPVDFVLDPNQFISDTVTSVKENPFQSVGAYGATYGAIKIGKAVLNVPATVNTWSTKGSFRTGGVPTPKKGLRARKPVSKAQQQKQTFNQFSMLPKDQRPLTPKDFGNIKVTEFTPGRPKGTPSYEVTYTPNELKAFSRTYNKQRGPATPPKPREFKGIEVGRPATVAPKAQGPPRLVTDKVPPPPPNIPKGAVITSRQVKSSFQLPKSFTEQATKGPQVRAVVGGGADTQLRLRAPKTQKAPEPTAKATRRKPKSVGYTDTTSTLDSIYGRKTPGNYQVVYDYSQAPAPSQGALRGGFRSRGMRDALYARLRERANERITPQPEAPPIVQQPAPVVTPQAPALPKLQIDFITRGDAADKAAAALGIKDLREERRETGIKYFPITTAGLFQESDTGAAQTSTPAFDVDTRPAYEYAQPQRLAQDTAEDYVFSPPVVSRSRSPRQPTPEPLRPVQEPPLRPVVPEPSRPRPFTPRVTRPEPKQEEPRPPFVPPRTPRLKAEPAPRGFNVLVRRAGVFRNVGRFSDVKAAFGYGEQFTSKTLAASFKVTTDDEETVKPLGFFDLRRFRTSKINQNVVVQRREQRLSSHGERSEIRLFGKLKNKWG